MIIAFTVGLVHSNLNPRKLIFIVSFFAILNGFNTKAMFGDFQQKRHFLPRYIISSITLQFQ